MKKIIIIIACVAITLGLFSSVFVFDPFKLNLNFIGRELTIEKTTNVVTEIKKISEFTTACFFEDRIIDQRKYNYFEKKINHKEQRNHNLGTIKKSAQSSWQKLKSATSSAIENAKQSSDSTVKGIAAAVGTAAKDIAVASGSSAKDLATSSAPALKDLVKADEVVVDSTEVGRIVFTVTTKVRAGYDLSKIEQEDLIVKGDTIMIKLPPVEIFDIIANPSDWSIFHREGNWDDTEIRNIQSGAKEIIRQDAINFGLMEKAEAFGKESLVSLFKTFGFSKVVLND
jgi:hypothetical protein